MNTGLPGGAQQASVGTTEVTIDLSALVKRDVLIWSDDQALTFSFSTSSSASQTLVVSGTSAASLTTLKADKTPVSVAVRRYVNPSAPYLVVKAAASGATVHIKVVSVQYGP